MALTIEKCQEMVLEFCSIYPVAAQLSYKIRDHQEELYGPEATKENVGTILGSFHPELGQADFAASNFRDADEFKGTLRHEVLGHFGINTFTADEKAGVLNAITEARDQPVLRTLWRKIDEWYSDVSERIKAEEVYAFMSERISHDRPVDPLAAEKSFREVCVEASRPMTERDLMNITSMVAQGMQDRTRTLQEHPWENYDAQRKGSNMESEKKPFHEIVAEKLIEQLKQGTAPWQKPWEPGEANSNMPFNPTTGNRYKGINALQLMSQGREDQRWMTYKQATAVDAQVRKGEKGTPIQYWKFSEEQNKVDSAGKPILDAKGEPVKETVKLERPRVFFATVFNAEQIDGLPAQQPRPEQTWNAVERAEAILQASGATIRHGEADRAFYRPGTDSIHLPDKSQFATADNYYATALHELGHWTGHSSRLDRDLVHPFGSEGYAKEELRAEISSMILGDELGIGHDPGQHAAYVGSWIKALEEDPLEIFRAAADAEKIHGYVLGLEQQQVQQQAATASLTDAERVETQQPPIATTQEVRDAAAVRAVLTADVGSVLMDRTSSFGHFEAYQGAERGETLQDALRDQGIFTVEDVTGAERDHFYERAIERLSAVFGIDPAHTETDNAYLERKGLAQAFVDKAEQLLQTLVEQIDKVAQFLVSNHNLAPEKVAENTRTAEPELKAVFADAERMAVISDQVDEQVESINSLRSDQAKAVMATTLQRPDAQEAVAAAQAARAELPENLDRDSHEAQIVADFIARNMSLLSEKIADNTMRAAPELKAVLGDQARMEQLDDQVNTILAGINETYIEQTKAVIASALGREDAQDLVASTERATAALQADIGAQNDTVQHVRDAQMVAQFLAANHNLVPEKVEANTRSAAPALQAILADPDRMATISDDVAELMGGINQAYIENTKAVIATTLQRPDAQEAVAAAQAARGELPASLSRDNDDAQLVADFLARNVNLLPEKIADNTMRAAPELKAVLGDQARMEKLDGQVNELLKGINATYVERTKAVIAGALGTAGALNQVASAAPAMSAPQDADAQRERDAQMVARFLASNHNLVPEKVAENTRKAAPALQTVLADSDRMAVISDQVAELVGGIHHVYIEETKAVIAATLQHPDAQEAMAAAQAARADMPTGSDRDRTEAKMVADFIARNMNLLPEKIAQNTQNAAPELKAVLGNPARMEQLDDQVNTLLKGINERYVERTKAVIADALSPSNADERPAQQFVTDRTQEQLKEYDAQLVADFLVSNHNLVPEKVAENILEAAPRLQVVLGNSERMAAIGSQVAALIDGINPAYIARTQQVAVAALTGGQAMTASEKSAEAVTARAEEWTIGRVVNDSLPRALDGATQEQVERIGTVLKNMQPLNTDNPFWQRHELPQDLELVDKKLNLALQLVDDRLAVIDDRSTSNEYEQAAKLAKVNEERVRRNPDSTDEDIVAAKEARKDAEFIAMTNDSDLQQRIAFEERQRVQQAQSDAAGRDQQKTFINVPFKEKEEAKALGAKWDRQEQSWYVPANIEPAPFAKWAKEPAKTAGDDVQVVSSAQSAPMAEKVAQDRQYLAVPYSERAEAKAAGAAWDKAAKSWFATPNADMDKLAKWKPENVSAQQGPAMTPREEFADALRSIGCVIPEGSEHPIMDGQRHRVSVEGEKFTEKSGSGFYVGHMDGHPAGFMQNNKTGANLKWKAKGYTLDPEQKALLAAEAAAKLQQRDADLAKQQDQAANRVVKEAAKLEPVVEPTAYMLAKGIEAHAGALTDKDGQKTYLPASDINGKQWTTQYIKEDGTKRFAKDSKKEGCFHVVGGMAELAKAPAIVIGEGYATAATLKQSLGFATVSAFDSGNLAAVAQALHQKFPDKPIVIAGDDDRHLAATQGVNPGRTKAEEAAKLVGGKAMLPIFAPGESSYPADLAPITPTQYRKHQSTGEGLANVQLEALAKMKQFTDFNDLATKSTLGKEAVDRQVRSFVNSVIEKHSQAQTDSLQQEQTRSAVIEQEKGQKLDEAPKRRKVAKVA